MVEPVEGIETVRALVWGFDGALGAAAVRGAGPHLEPDHQ